jgi:hypothetical protein
VEIGLLLNFGSKSLIVKRLLNKKYKPWDKIPWIQKIRLIQVQTKRCNPGSEI